MPSFKPAESGVLKLLEAALQRVGSDPHLQSLQGIVRETVERERVEQRKRDLLQRAKECLRRKEFSEAIEILEGASAQFHKDGDVSRTCFNLQKRKRLSTSRRKPRKQLSRRLAF